MVPPFVASLIEPVFYSVIRGTSGRGFTRSGRGYMEEKNLVLLHLFSNIEIIKYFIGVFLGTFYLE